MKVLDPQSALLTNAEVYQFLQSNPPRKPEKQIGSYAATNLTGYTAVRKDFDRYTKETTPHIPGLDSVQKWMPQLVKRLKPFELTKTEVLNMTNVGVGIRGSQRQAEVKSEDEEDGPDEEAEMARDVQFFKVAVEEADDRFPGDEGEERIREAVAIMKETVRSVEATNGMNGAEEDDVNGDSGRTSKIVEKPTRL